MLPSRAPSVATPTPTPTTMTTTSRWMFGGCAGSITKRSAIANCGGVHDRARRPSSPNSRRTRGGDPSPRATSGGTISFMSGRGSSPATTTATSEADPDEERNRHSQGIGSGVDRGAAEDVGAGGGEWITAVTFPIVANTNSSASNTAASSTPPASAASTDGSVAEVFLDAGTKIGSTTQTWASDAAPSRASACNTPVPAGGDPRCGCHANMMVPATPLCAVLTCWPPRRFGVAAGGSA